MLLIEREDSISVNWAKCVKALNINSRDMIGYDTFINLFKMFRLEEM